VPDPLLALPFGVAVGLSLGLVGAGGSLLTVPVLVYVLGLSAREATTSSLLIVGLTAATGTASHARRGTVRWPVAASFGLAAAVGTVGGTALNRLVDEQALLLAFGFLMLGAAYALGRGRSVSAAAPAAGPSARVAVAGLAVGVLTGLFGVGGGFVIVPVLVLTLGFPIEAAVGTSLAVIAIASTAALAGHLATGEIDWKVTGAFVGAAVVGVLAGSRLSGRLSPHVLARSLAAVVAAVGLFLIARGAAAYL
jgi:hypothetical protein